MTATPVLYQITPDCDMLMNCYVIKTAGGHLIVIDGGGAGSEKNNGYLYKKLQEISGSECPVIDAWFLSHMHDDHTNEFIIIGNDESKKITVKKIYMNFASRQFMQSSEGGRFYYLYDGIISAYDRFFGAGAFEKVNGKTAFEGDVIEIDGVKIEIMLTVSDEEKEKNINDTSMIFRAYIEGQTVLFLGDGHIEVSERLMEKYGESLKSDIVQMAHHGQNGVTFEVYKTVCPKLCLWPTPIWVYENKQGIYQTTEVRRFMMDMGVKHHIVAGVDLTQSLSFPVDFESLPENDITP